MESKKINQLATEMSPASSDLTIIGDPITGVSKKVTLEQISSLFASSISFYTNYASFPATGSVDTLYCAKDTNKLYLWSGSAYVETFPSQALLDTYQLRSEKGNANGYASLDGSGKVPSTQLPSYVDDVIEVANYASLPVTGETGKIYITLDNNKIYRWSGSVYVEIASNNAIWGSITGTLSNQTDLQNALNAKVPYTGATANVNLGEYELKTGQLTLDTTPTGTATVGTTRWNDTIGSSETTLKGGNVILKNGVDLVARVVNKVSPNTTLTKAAYPAVRVSGAQGQRLAVAYAQANNDNNSADTIGLVTETIATNQEGFIITVGQLEGINTTGSLQGETWADGDVLYLSPTTAGALTNIKPTGATGHIVVIGYVEYAHANNGKIYVKVMNGWELDELHNVYISSVANNQGLFYESSSDLWKNKSIATVLGYTPISLTSLSASSPLSYNNTTGAFSISQASGSTNGFLSSTDWTTFNNKQNALTNPITGTGANGRIAYFNGTTTQTSSAFLTWDNTDAILSTNSIYNFNNTTNAYMLSSNGENIGSIFNVASAKWSLGYGTSTTALGTPALTWDTSGRVGIGTTSPTTRLHVAGDIQSTTGVFLANTGGYFMTLNTLNGMYIDSTNYLTLNTNGLERVRINTNGTFSIGNTNNTFNLDVTGTGRFTGALTGTSASFSSSVTALNLNAVSTNPYLILNDTSGSASGAITFQSNGTQKWNLASQATSQDLGLYNNGGTNSFNLYIKYSTGSIGIGTTTPNSVLEVYGQTRISASLGSVLLITPDATSTNGVTLESSYYGTAGYGPMKFNTSGSERMRITSSGTVCIGGTDTGEKLNIVSGNIKLYSYQFTAGDYRYIGSEYAQGNGNNRAEVRFGIDTPGDTRTYLGFATTSVGGSVTERMRINSVGNVGIGTTAPNSLLEVKGATPFIRLTDTSASSETGFIMDNTGGFIRGGLTINHSSGEFKHYCGVSSNSYFQTFFTNGSERMRITSTGNVGIGTSSPLSALDKTLTVFGTGIFQTTTGAGNYNENLRLNRNTGNGYASLALGGAYNSTAGSGVGQWTLAATPVALSYRLDFDYNATTKGYIDPSTGAYVALSDRNKKKDFEDNTIGLNAILGLKTTLYRMIDEDESVKKQLGFIAQDVKDFIPQAYSETVDGFVGLQDRPIIAALVKAVQELKAEIEELKNK